MGKYSVFKGRDRVSKQKRIVFTDVLVSRYTKQHQKILMCPQGAHTEVKEKCGFFLAEENCWKQNHSFHRSLLREAQWHQGGKTERSGT